MRFATKFFQLGRVCNRRSYNKQSYVPSKLEPGQYPYEKRQIPLSGLKSFAQRSKDIREAAAKPRVTSTNIGFKIASSSDEAEHNSKHQEKNSNKCKEMEKLARRRELLIDLESVNDSWRSTLLSSSHITSSLNENKSPSHLRDLAQHFGVFDALFCGGLHFFDAVVPLNVSFSQSPPSSSINSIASSSSGDNQHDLDDEGGVCEVPVCYGNLLRPNCATKPPSRISITLPPPTSSSNKKKDCNLWTLTMTSLDEYFGELFEHEEEFDVETNQPRIIEKTEINKPEVLHWMVSNVEATPIPNSDDSADQSGSNEWELRVAEGHTVTPYLPPIPYFGSGFHRYVFVLYKQDAPIKINEDMKNKNYNQLSSRVFSTHEFLRQHQASLTPASFSFFQAAWDESVRHTFRHVLQSVERHDSESGVEEPIFQYKWPERRLRPQQRYPVGVSFNEYLDQYRDVKEVREHVLTEKLNETRVFSSQLPERVPYPMALPMTRKDFPSSWMRDVEEQKRLRKGIYKALNDL